jgi:hypothetical protein
MDINADAQEVIKALGDRVAALSIEVEILRVALNSCRGELETEKSAATELANALLAQMSPQRRDFSKESYNFSGEPQL